MSKKKKEVSDTPEKWNTADAARVFDMLGDPTRLAIVEQLAADPTNVTDLCAALELKQPNLSHHLGLLRNSGLVESTRTDRTVVYAIRPDGFKAATDFLAGL